MPAILRSKIHLPALLLLAVAPVFAQLDLSLINIRTVRRVDAGLVALPSFDSVGMDVKVDNGIVRTHATLVWTATAGAKRSYRWTCYAPDPETTFVSENSWLNNSLNLFHDTVITVRSSQFDNATGEIDSNYSYTYRARTTSCKVTDVNWVETKVDSLELSASFSLPVDAAVTDLALWVGDKRQSAWLMDRSKASAQYNSIVGVRRDPALLETSGNGSYTLRVFPQSTGETRRLEIEFVQAWRKGVILPIHFTRPPGLQTSIWRDTAFTINTRFAPNPRRVGITLSSVDGSAVTLDLGAEGTLTAGAIAQSKTLDSNESFTATATGGLRESWSAVRDGRPAFGSRVVFRGSEFTVAPEPKERVVFLDCLHKTERARRLALLALIQYGAKDGNRVNLLWRDRDGAIKRLWDAPKKLTTEAALEAVAALKAWVPSDSVTPLASLRGLLATDSGRVVIHISDVGPEVFPEPYPMTGTNAEYTAYYQRSNTFYQAGTQAWLALGDTLHKRGMKLFGWWRDNQAFNAATATGGYQFGNIESATWGWWRTGDTLVVPELFGTKRRGWEEGLQGLSLDHSGMAIDSLASDLALPSYGYVPDILFIEPRIRVLAQRSSSSTVLAARSAVAAIPESLVVTLAGRSSGPGTLELKAHGFWGGLDVSAKRTLAVSAVGGTAGASVWAREYANMLQPWVWTRDTATNAVRTLGRSYRIATSATSFLALEPGVAPFDSLGGQGTSSEGVTVTADASVRSVSGSFVVLDTVVANTGNILLDTLSLESMLIGRVLATERPTKSAPVIRGMKLVSNGGLEILAGSSSEAPRIRILDVSGREIATPSMRRTEAGWSATWQPAKSSLVLVQMVQDGKVYTHRTVVQP